MGLNTDNLFVNCNDNSRVADALVQSLQHPSKWKMAMSEPINGWIQIVDSHAEIEKELAQHLSELLQCPAILAQLYEVTGDVLWHCWDRGHPQETHENDNSDDPAGEIETFLKTKGIQNKMHLFEEVFKRGWKIVQQKK